MEKRCTNPSVLSDRTGPDRITCQFLMHACVSTQPQASDRITCQFLMLATRQHSLLGQTMQEMSTPRKMRRMLQTVQHFAARRQLEAWESERIGESEERIEGLHHAHLIEWLHNSTPIDYGPQYCAVCKMWLHNSAQMQSHCVGKKHRKNQKRALETAPWRSVTLEARNDSV